MKTLTRTLLILTALILSACSLGGKTVPLTIIEPQLDPIETAGLRAVDWAIEVPRPITDQTRDSDRLIVRRDGGRLQVYPGVSWVDSLPDMVQTLLVQAFTDSATVAAAARSGIQRPLRPGHGTAPLRARRRWPRSPGRTRHHRSTDRPREVIDRGRTNLPIDRKA